MECRLWKGVVGRSRPILQIVSPWRDWIVVATIFAETTVVTATTVAIGTSVAIVTAIAIREIVILVAAPDIDIVTVDIFLGTKAAVCKETLIAIVVEPHSHRFGRWEL